MLLLIILLVVGFALLIKGADFLVEGATSLAKYFGVSDLVVGLTVVAFGTSTPELFVNIISSYNGNADVALGNVVGSNTFNILLILGVSALVYPLHIAKSTVWKETPYSLLAAIVLLILGNDQWFNGQHSMILTRGDGIIFLFFFVLFIVYMFSLPKADQELIEKPVQTLKNLGGSVFFVILGLCFLVLGAKITVDAAVKLAQSLGVSEALIGLTIVAGGTSLPELATSAVAAYKKKPDIAVGNIVGSNIFNIFFIMGVSTLIRPLPYTLDFNFDIGICIFATVLLFVLTVTGKKYVLSRREGVVFLIFYVLYIVLLLKRA
jgi:cation:H+ antiporter